MDRNLDLLISADLVAQSVKQMSSSSRELGKRLESISMAEIESKDRVNISLKEYERMKRENDLLESEVHYLRGILEKIEAPLDKNIIPDIIRTYCYDDHLNCRRVFRVEFAIDEWEMTK